MTGSTVLGQCLFGAAFQAQDRGLGGHFLLPDLQQVAEIVCQRRTRLWSSVCVCADVLSVSGCRLTSIHIETFCVSGELTTRCFHPRASAAVQRGPEIQKPVGDVDGQHAVRLGSDGSRGRKLRVSAGEWGWRRPKTRPPEGNRNFAAARARARAAHRRERSQFSPWEARRKSNCVLRELDHQRVDLVERIPIAGFAHCWPAFPHRARRFRHGHYLGPARTPARGPRRSAVRSRWWAACGDRRRES